MCCLVKHFWAFRLWLNFFWLRLGCRLLPTCFPIGRVDPLWVWVRYQVTVGVRSDLYAAVPHLVTK